jgi:hypothetical protein
LLQQLRVLGQAVEPFQQHASRHAAAHGVALVVREVDATRMLEQRKHIVDRRVVGRFVGPSLVRRHGIRVAADARDLLADLLGRQHIVGCAGRDHAARHARVLGAVVLDEGDAAGGLDLLHAEHAIAARA